MKPHTVLILSVVIIGGAIWLDLKLNPPKPLDSPSVVAAQRDLTRGRIVMLTTVPGLYEVRSDKPAVVCGPDGLHVGDEVYYSRRDLEIVAFPGEGSPQGPKTERNFAAEVKAFNDAHPVGSPVSYRTGPRGDWTRSRIRRRAFVYQGFVPCVHVEGRRAYVFLENVLPAGKETSP